MAKAARSGSVRARLLSGVALVVFAVSTGDAFAQTTNEPSHQTLTDGKRHPQKPRATKNEPGTVSRKTANSPASPKPSSSNGVAGASGSTLPSSKAVGNVTGASTLANSTPTSTHSQSSVGGYGAGTIAFPMGNGFGTSIDSLLGEQSPTSYVGAADHLYWRNPSFGLIGVYGSLAYAIELVSKQDSGFGTVDLHKARPLVRGVFWAVQCGGARRMGNRRAIEQFVLHVR